MPPFASVRCEIWKCSEESAEGSICDVNRSMASKLRMMAGRPRRAEACMGMVVVGFATFVLAMECGREGVVLACHQVSTYSPTVSSHHLITGASAD